jgi:hypothetical protein
MSFDTPSGCYHPIPPQPGSIRLLLLRPSEDENAPIQCQLVHYSVQYSSGQTHLHEALSYAWGIENKLQTVSIGNYELPIIASLHNALTRLQHYILPQVLWVDAVCIYSHRNIITYFEFVKIIPQLSKGFNCAYLTS